MTSDRSSEKDGGLLAAEYALGLLTGDEQAEARRLEATDAEFARLVTDWEIRFAALADELPDETPSPSTKKALLAEVFPEAEKAPFFQRLWIWQAGAALSLLVLATVVFLEFDTPGQVSGPLYTAEIAADAGDFQGRGRRRQIHG